MPSANIPATPAQLTFLHVENLEIPADKLPQVAELLHVTHPEEVERELWSRGYAAAASHRGLQIVGLSGDWLNREDLDVLDTLAAVLPDHAEVVVAEYRTTRPSYGLRITGGTLNVIDDVQTDYTF